MQLITILGVNVMNEELMYTIFEGVKEKYSDSEMDFDSEGCSIYVRRESGTSFCFDYVAEEKRFYVSMLNTNSNTEVKGRVESVRGLHGILDFLENNFEYAIDFEGY